MYKPVFITGFFISALKSQVFYAKIIMTFIYYLSNKIQHDCLIIIRQFFLH